MMEALTTRDKIIELGRDLMQGIGYHSFNYKQVGAILNIKNSSIHHYFPSKEDLAIAVIEKDLNNFRHMVTGIASLSPTQKVNCLMDNYSQYLKNGKKLCVISTFGSTFNNVSEKIQQALRSHSIFVRAWLNEVLLDGQKKGEFTFKSKVEELTGLWMASLPGSLIIGRIQGEEYFNQIMNQLKASLTEK